MVICQVSYVNWEDCAVGEKTDSKPESGSIEKVYGEVVFVVSFNFDLDGGWSGCHDWYFVIIMANEIERYLISTSVRMGACVKYNCPV